MLFHIYVNGFMSKRAILHVKTIFFPYHAFKGWQYIEWNFSVTHINYKPMELFRFSPVMEKESQGNNESIFTFKWQHSGDDIFTGKSGMLFLDCGSVQALIIHSETCGSLVGASWLFTYLGICLPLSLYLRMSILPVVHHQWKISPFA